MNETWVTLGVVCMGLGGVVAGLVGVMLPEGRRLGALFGLIAGAGVGTGGRSVLGPFWTRRTNRQT